eukprot:15359844-Ditylum_brightwellii.AAC.1
MASQDSTLHVAMSDKQQVMVDLKFVYDYVNKDLFFSGIFPYEEVEASLYGPNNIKRTKKSICHTSWDKGPEA